MMNVGLHMRIIGHPSRSEAVRNFIKYAQSFKDVWFATRIEIAEHWMSHHP